MKLRDIKKDDLPEEHARDGPRAERDLDKADQASGRHEQAGRELDKKRSEFIAKKLAEKTKNPAAESFDNQVLRILQTQARRNGIEYATPAVEKKKE